MIDLQENCPMSLEEPDSDVSINDVLEDSASPGQQNNLESDLSDDSITTPLDEIQSELLEDDEPQNNVDVSYQSDQSFELDDFEYEDATESTYSGRDSSDSNNVCMNTCQIK